MEVPRQARVAGGRIGGLTGEVGGVAGGWLKEEGSRSRRQIGMGVVGFQVAESGPGTPTIARIEKT
jgi:hypothetical protein